MSIPPSLLRRLASALFVFGSCALPCVALAPRTGQETEQAPRDAQGFDSPRAVVEALLGVYAFERNGDQAALDRAAETLQLEGSGLVRKQRAQRLVQRLGSVFDHVAVLDPARVADELEPAGADRASWSAASEVDPSLVVRLGFVRTPQGWLIDADTVARIDGWYERSEGLERIAQARDKPRSPTEVVRALVPRQLKGGGFLLEAWQWIGLLLLFLLAFFSERLITLFLRPLVRKLSRFEGINVEPELLARFERPFGWLLLGLLFALGIGVLDLPTGVFTTLRIAIGVFTTFTAVWACYRMVDIVCWPLEVKAARTASKFDDMLVPLLRRTLKVLVFLVGFMFVLSRVTGDLWHVLAGLSIGSLAIGFAAKDSIENLFGTFTVLLDSPFKIGDLVKFADIEGTVEEVGFRSTRIRTAEDSLVTVPNSRFIGSAVDNLGSRRGRRVKLTLSLTYDTPPESIEALCEGLRELVRVHPWTKKENYHVWLSNLAASSLDVELICFVETLDYATYVRERHRLLLDILRLAQRLEVAFAFPTQTVWQARAEDLLHPDAPGSSAEAIERGRTRAREVTAITLARHRQAPPPPVRFEPDDPDAIGS